ncbi:peptide/nickel transport system substrate-binding protein [Constrictibacter sp. MBR-5]|jgi:ABC-type transport system substrate-binding protein|uniref:ABC transporter substrate-binding protein n=1 Tax=Constrictibacter sp. MBR-5 TaxID=3156467 RepID=UPI00339B944F
MKTRFRIARGVALGAMMMAFGAGAAQAAGTLRIAMTAADVPTTTGMPNNGYEGMRFLGYPVFEALVMWDLSSADKVADIKPGLAESWSQSKDDPTKWTFNLRKGVKFHDGSAFDADAVIWNLERFYDPKSPQAETQGGAIVRGRVPNVKSWKKVDAHTLEITTDKPLSYFPYLAPYILFASPTQFDKVGKDWAKFAAAPAGTGAFKIVDFQPRVSVTMERNDDYWDAAHKAKLDKLILYPMPEATTRLAALRSGQVDWIEVPPPDAIPSLKGAGFDIVTNSYPHVWPWVLNIGKADSPFKDLKVRQAANYCVDRDGMSELLNGTAEPSVGFYKKVDPNFGKPKNAYGFEPDKAKALMKEAGYSADKPAKVKVMISTSGSGQMQPLPMNEFLQQTLAECWFDVSFEVVEWGTVLVAFRNDPTGSQALGSDALNISLVSSDIAQMARWFWSANFAPNGSNWGHWKNDEFDTLLSEIQTSTDQSVMLKNLPRLNEILVDDAPWLWVVHDLNPRAMTKDVQGFVSAQSWFQDLTTVSMKK